MGVLRARAMRSILLSVAGMALVAGCGDADAPDDAIEAIRAPEIARIRPAEAVLEGAHVPTLDPGTMSDAEIRKAIGSGPRCEFRYTSGGRPVLAVDIHPDGTSRRGVVTLNGDLVLLAVAPADSGSPEGGAEGLTAPADALVLAAEPVRMTIWPAPGDPTGIAAAAAGLEATMVFMVGDRLRVGYRGYLDCAFAPPPG